MPKRDDNLIDAQIAQLMAETMKLQEEGAKMRQDTKYPPVIVAALVLALSGVVTQIVTAITQ